MRLSRKLHHQLEDFFREFFGDENLRLPEIEICCGRNANVVTKLLGVHGITLGRYIFIKPDLIYRRNSAERYISKNLLAHEATHVLQYQNFGALKFLYQYFKSYFLSLREKKSWNAGARLQAYLDIPFEAEARAGGAGFVDWTINERKTGN